MSASSYHAKSKMATLNLQTLLKERNEALEKASNLGRQYNALLPISTLPLELLLKIFHYYTTSHPGDGDPSALARNISQICHHWRKAALGASTLWSQLIECQHLPPKWLQVVLRRARSSPLHVRILPLDETEGVRNFTAPNVHLALRDLGNIGALDILCSLQEGILQPMIKHFQQPAPSLKHLTMGILDQGDPSLPRIGFQLLPANLFCGTTGPLQHLNLYRCLIDMQSPLYHHLTFLYVEQIPPQMAPSVFQWLDILRTAPNLLFVKLYSVFSPSAIVGRVQNVHLPQLSMLTIGGHFTPCSQFLSHLRYPALHTFDLQMFDFDPEPTTVPNLSSIIKYPLSKAKPFRLCVAYVNDSLVKITNRSSEEPTEIENTLFSVSCILDSSAAPPQDARALLSLLVKDITPRTSHCEKLSLRLFAGYSLFQSLDTWFGDVIRAFSSVKTLEIIDPVEMMRIDQMDKFLSYLSTPDSEQPSDTTYDDDTAPTRVLLPNLQDLFLNVAQLPDALITFLEYRKKCGLAVQTIHFSSNFDDWAALESIRSLCSSVEVVMPVAPVVASPMKEYFDYEGEEDIDPEIDDVAG